MTRTHTAFGRLGSHTLKLTGPMSVSTMSWVGLVIATISLLGAFHLRLESVNFGKDVKADHSTFTLVKNGFMELWKSGESMEAIGNSRDPFGSDYW